MNAIERQTAIGVASLMALRMLGLFLLIPVLPVLGLALPGASYVLVGLAVGIYGLTQAVFQLPFGWLSDRWGRHPVIALGLVLFVLGGLVAAYSEHMYGVILGRALQGSGAVASALMALLSDVSRETNRSKLMAIVGMSIGGSFMLAILLGPVLAQWWGLSELFGLTAGAGLLGLCVLYWGLPRPSEIRPANDALQQGDHLPAFRQAAMACLSSAPLVMLMVSVGLLHLLMTAVFVVLPSQLVALFGWPLSDHWQLYLPLMVMTLVCVFPALGWVEKQKAHALLMVVGFVGFGSALGILMLLDRSVSWLIVGFFVAFLAFSLLEALLPSLVSRMAPSQIKGTALGLFSMSQFFGAFLGGSLAGWVLQHAWIQGFFLSVMLVSLIWAWYIHRQFVVG